MSNWLKFLIGLAAALAMGWISHGPLGRGEALADRLETEAKVVVRAAGVPGVGARIEREPLTREIVLRGPADDFQREGQGLFPGINDRVRAVPGVSGIRWEESACCAQEE